MKMLRLTLLLSIGLAACGGSPPPPPEDDEPEALSVTRWTPRTELFAEFAPLTVGQTSRFAIHLTNLTTFAPVTAGQVEVQLRSPGGAPEVFTVDGPSRPGIFGVDVQPARAGQRQLVILLRSGDLADEHQVGAVEV